MAAHLDTVRLRPDVVGMMDHPMRQPQQPLFDGLQVMRIGDVFCRHCQPQAVDRRIFRDPVGPSLPGTGAVCPTECTSFPPPPQCDMLEIYRIGVLYAES